MTTYATNSIVPPASPTHTTWWERFQEQGYAFRFVAIATIVTGIYLHVTRLLIGDTLLQQTILTPLFDQYFALPIAYAGITGLLSWRRMHFRGRGHKVLIGFIAFYMLPLGFFKVGTWGVSTVLLLCTIGDFRFVGFFKRVRNSAFARNDTLFYSPLCFCLAVSCATVNLWVGA